MGAPRFTEVPASLEEVGSGVVARIAQWGLLIASGVADHLTAWESGRNDSDAPRFGDRLDEAVRAAAAPSAAPTLLLALAVVVWLLRQAALAVSAAGLVRESLDAERCQRDKAE